MNILLLEDNAEQRNYIRHILLTGCIRMRHLSRSKKTLRRRPDRADAIGYRGTGRQRTRIRHRLTGKNGLCIHSHLFYHGLCGTGAAGISKCCMLRFFEQTHCPRRTHTPAFSFSERQAGRQFFRSRSEGQLRAISCAETGYLICRESRSQTLYAAQHRSLL